MSDKTQQPIFIFSPNIHISRRYAALHDMDRCFTRFILKRENLYPLRSGQGVTVIYLYGDEHDLFGWWKPEQIETYLELMWLNHTGAINLKALRIVSNNQKTGR